MSTSDGAAASERLRQALDLFEAGVSMKRASLRRQYPDADADEIDQLIRVWLATRPGAEQWPASSL